MKNLTQERVRRLFTYDGEAGLLYWNRRPLSDFATVRAHSLWNTKHAGQPAGSRSKAGYIRVKIDDQKHLAHRLIWLWVHGSWPSGVIDHIHGDPADNRLAGMRDVPQSENQRNQKMPSTNNSGRVGVRQLVASSRWRAEIEVNGRKRHLGTFNSFEKAVRAREDAESFFQFASGHGRPGHTT